MTLKLHNTKSNKLEPFTPIADERVALYTCGPTVYDYPHVGNWASYIYWDTLVRTLIANGYRVERVMNITDVGHLVSDADEGEDKLEKGARREHKTAWQIAEFYAEDFLAGMEKLGLIPPEHIAKATDYIPQQLDLIRTLKEQGYTYQTTDGIYFDTSKFPTYADFAHLDLKAQKAGARVEANSEKRQAWDFALWKFTPAGQKRDMEWETPDDLLELPRVGASADGPVADDEISAARASDDANSTEARREAISESAQGNTTSRNKAAVMGFPGWHLECSAMAMNILGPTIDIHTGGIDHIPVHHTNEIAQSEAASGQEFAHYWLHNNHLKIDGGKISKSLGNGYTLQELTSRGYDPMDFRMFVLQSDYASEGNFTWENLDAAKNRRHNWLDLAALRHQIHHATNGDNTVSLYGASSALLDALSNNLATAQALQIVDDAFNQVSNASLHAIDHTSFVEFLETIDELLGLQLLHDSPDISDEQKMILVERERAREAKDWSKADDVRQKLESAGITVRDTADGVIWSYVN